MHGFRVLTHRPTLPSANASAGMHAGSNDAALDLFCASPPPGLVSDGRGPDYVTITYESAQNGAITSNSPQALSARSPTLCPPDLLLQSGVISVVGPGSAQAFSITVVDRDLAPQLNPDLSAAGSAGQEPVRVKVVSSRIDEPSDTILLQQASAEEGAFTGFINISQAIVPGAENDGLVRVEPGDTLQLIYFPAHYIRPRNPVVRHVRAWNNCSLRLLPVPVPSLEPSAPAKRDVSVVGMGRQLTIEVVDPDQNLDVHQTGENNGVLKRMFVGL